MFPSPGFVPTRTEYTDRVHSFISLNYEDDPDRKTEFCVTNKMLANFTV